MTAQGDEKKLGPGDKLPDGRDWYPGYEEQLAALNERKALRCAGMLNKPVRGCGGLPGILKGMRSKPEEYEAFRKAVKRAERRIRRETRRR